MAGTALLALAVASVLKPNLWNGMMAVSLMWWPWYARLVFGLTTALQLIEISRPDFPLLQFFLRHAPGTYQHSLQVANLAEQAAELPRVLAAHVRDVAAFLEAVVAFLGGIDERPFHGGRNHDNHRRAGAVGNIPEIANHRIACRTDAGTGCGRNQ